MTTASYQQFCPVAMAAEILCTRWTIVVLREMFAGSSRFNELRRGVPRMSPALLSRRLKELEAAGVVAREVSTSDPAVFEYQLTEAGRELGPLVEAFGIWGQRRIESDLALAHLDADLLKRGGVCLSQAAGRAATLLAGRRPRNRRRSLQDRPWVRGRSLCHRRPSNHDGDLDGIRYRARRDREPEDDFDGRPAARNLDAGLARPQSVREGAQARKLSDGSPCRKAAVSVT